MFEREKSSWYMMAETTYVTRTIVNLGSSTQSSCFKHIKIEYSQVNKNYCIHLHLNSSESLEQNERINQLYLELQPFFSSAPRRDEDVLVFEDCQNPALFNRVIDVLSVTANFDKKIKIDLKKYLEIQTYYQDEILNLVKNHELHDILKMTNEFDPDGTANAALHLLLYYMERENMAAALQVYDALPQIKSVYEDINGRIIALINTIIGRDKKILTREKKLQYRKYQMEWAVRANENPLLLDAIFARVAGKSTLCKIENNAETIVAIAREIRDLRAQIAMHEAKLQDPSLSLCTVKNAQITEEEMVEKEETPAYQPDPAVMSDHAMCFATANSLFAAGKYNEAACYYQALIAANDYYREANEQMIYVLDAVLFSEEAKEFSPAEIEKYKEAQLEHALNADYSQQADRFFHYLSGGAEKGLSFEIQNLRMDADSFMQLALTMRGLNDRLQALQLQLEPGVAASLNQFGVLAWDGREKEPEVIARNGLQM